MKFTCSSTINAPRDFVADFRHREVPGHDGVHREHERRRQPREVEDRAVVRLPLAGGALPAQRQNAVEHFLEPGRAVARNGDVGNQPDVEEDDRDRHVGVDREHVPEQRALEVHPEAALVRVGKQEVELPEATDVDQRKERRGEHGEDRHRLGAAVDRIAPLRAEQEEDRGDQGARVTDSDPEHEGDDVDAPEDRRLVARDPEPLIGLVGERSNRPARRRASRARAARSTARLP